MIFVFIPCPGIIVNAEFLRGKDRVPAGFFLLLVVPEDCHRLRCHQDNGDDIRPAQKAVANIAQSPDSIRIHQAAKEGSQHEDNPHGIQCQLVALEQVADICLRLIAVAGQGGKHEQHDNHRQHLAAPCPEGIHQSVLGPLDAGLNITDAAEQQSPLPV